MAANPTLLSMPIAENGTKNTIPETQATPGNGLMSQSTGFPAECSLPLGAGGTAPDRADFNGAFNLLGGVAFMAQKGFTFNYDAAQDYYAGCVVIDGGNRYLCIADMAAGTVAPSADTTHDYWIFYPVGVINKRDIVTTSGTYTAPVSGWYKITIKGGGGGGGGGTAAAASAYGGGGGGEGGIGIGYEFMVAGQTAAVVIGAGGSGGAVGSSGSGGGASSVTVNGNVIIGGAGGAGARYCAAGSGGAGTVYGNAGDSGSSAFADNNSPAFGGSGGGNGGGSNGGLNAAGNAGANGGGGGGGSGQIGGTAYVGGNGGDGFAWFEYFAAV